MTLKENVTILIPAYNPDDKLTTLVKEIIENRFSKIIVVNDGSKSECNKIFVDLSILEPCTVIHHSVNKGKGGALKTGISYFLENFKESKGIVTVDADGQHAVEDIVKTAEKLYEKENSLVLGVRDFSSQDIPFRSKFGNLVTKSVVNFACGIKISDTQTGLRGIPRSFAGTLLNVSGDRYEYEMNMLLECKSHNIPMEEVKIRTIYIDENDSSHFNPIVDSIKIYSVFFKFIFSSLGSFVVDILLFTVLTMLLKNVLPIAFIIVSTILARVLSSLFNYTVNKNVVFKSGSKNTIQKYFTLSVVQMLTSAALVQLVYFSIGEGEVWIKIVVDSILFLISFVIQREWVFNKKSTRKYRGA
ncbi:glycosyltransferase [Sutcliffiella halmapala]